MTKSRKAELLYRKAKGVRMNATSEELKELHKYKVDANEDEFYTTKSNINSYITAVDNGTRISFYDWCMNNKKADRRRRGSSEEKMGRENRTGELSAMFLGWLTWGLAIYWIFGENLSVSFCAIAGMAVSALLYRCARAKAIWTIFLFPIVLMAIFGSQ